MSDIIRNSILCPTCRKLISSDEKNCPFCGTARPGSALRNNIWVRSFSDPARFIKAVIYINIGIYIISLLFNPRATTISMNPLTLLSPSNPSLILLGATGIVPIDHFQQLIVELTGKTALLMDRFPRWWTIISAGFLHGGILHIFFNMTAFRQVAAIVTREFGLYRMFIIYSLGGVIGFLVSYLAGVYFTIGASAGVCGLVGALLYYGKSRGGAYGTAIFKQIGMWVVIMFIFGFVVPGINNWGHGGGLLGGVIFGFLLGYREKRRETAAHKMTAGIFAVVTIAVLFLAVGSALYYRFAV